MAPIKTFQVPFYCKIFVLFLAFIKSYVKNNNHQTSKLYRDSDNHPIYK